MTRTDQTYLVFIWTGTSPVGSECQFEALDRWKRKRMLIGPKTRRDLFVSQFNPARAGTIVCSE